MCISQLENGYIPIGVVKKALNIMKPMLFYLGLFTLYLKGKKIVDNHLKQ